MVVKATVEPSPPYVGLALLTAMVSSLSDTEKESSGTFELKVASKVAVSEGG